MKSASFLFSALLTFAISAVTQAQSLQMPSIFGDHMVLQRDATLPIWGTAEPGSFVNVKFAGQEANAKADEKGAWRVDLKPVALQPHSLQLVAKSSTGDELVFSNIVMGDVWVCSGQSNMRWRVEGSYDADLERLQANNPNLRHIRVPDVGTQELQSDFDGVWEMTTPETVGPFTAVGYHFGSQINRITGVPIGLINNAWGGSSADAWIRRDVYDADPAFAEQVKTWSELEKTYSYEKELAAWKEKAAKAKAAGKQAPRRPADKMTGNQRPGNLFAGKISPLMPFAIKGVIWYQGESNSRRAVQYRHMFPKMITHWREEWGQGDFPFYWSQLADYRNEVDEPGDSSWAELREAQTMTLSLPNTGQAVIHDIGEGRDIHPRDKQNVGRRLARLALANDYGIDILSRSPSLEKATFQDGKAILTIKDIGSRLYSFDTKQLIGFELAGKDQVWHPAQAEFKGKNGIHVQSEKVAEPVAARYAWADNPIANVMSWEGLPLTSFRTDDWPRSTGPEKGE